jgi:hypothetical protein
MGLIRLDPTVEDEAKRDRAISIFLLLQKIFFEKMKRMCEEDLKD